ncbi:VanZ like family protein [Owenweeksia hongkongensis DSM 17368]|uniref:VanZ like family protein n=1 Tax=Owenweeksia hongkongensis (strain DSM 17368 / CIP 108786 / JCM 12287 / NRRL B-23963 / UST20020801) TaxID=926562 RepID=G8R2A0_OWEHD|nr:VanZ family protein [Owenweeksia hongkongensis]AEV32890.1 VanZ like family protein [Owenweeksia hongkongensis DSM 17368]
MPTKKQPESKHSAYIILHFTPALVWGIFILYFSTMPGPEVPNVFQSLNDKLIHAAIYFVATILIYFGFLRFKYGNPISGKALFISCLISIVFGGVIELLQSYYVPGRVGDWFDFVANTSGSLSFVLMLVVSHRALA